MDARGRNELGRAGAVGQICAPERGMHKLAKAFILLVSLSGLGAWSGSSYAATCTSIVSGNWNAQSTWGLLGGCLGATGGIPGAGDTVNIAAGDFVTLTAPASATSVTIANPGSSAIGNGIALNGNTLTVSGGVTMARPTGSRSSTIDVGTGTLNAGSITINGGSNTSRVATVTVSTGTINVVGNFTFAQTAAQARFVSTGASMVNVGGNFTSGGTLTTNGTGTINFNGTGAAQSMGVYTTYNNVTIANTNAAGVVTMLGNSSMTGALTVTSGTLDKNTRTLGVAGDLTVNGAITGTSGNITLSGAGHTIDGTGSITTTTGLLSITAAQAINATAHLTIASRIAITGAVTVTNNGWIDSTSTTGITGSVAGSTWTNAANSTLNVAGPLLAIGTLDASATGNTVNYTDTIPPQVVDTPSGTPATYYNLTLSGTGTKTMPATALTVLGDFAMSGTATATAAANLTVGSNFTIGANTTFADNGSTYSVGGNWTNDGTFTATTGTVAFTAAGAQIIRGASITDFANFSVGPSTTLTLEQNATVTGVVTGTIVLNQNCPDRTLTLVVSGVVLHSCPTPPVNFNCVEAGASESTGHLYTKLAGTGFSFDVVALKADGTVETTYASNSTAASKNVTVELVDGSGTTACASRTAISPAVSQTLSFAVTDAGRKAAASMTVSKAYPDLRCRVTDANQVPNIVGCSTDNFSVRPVSLTLTATGLGADAAGTSTTATPAVKAGASFTLTATASDMGYTGTPTLDNTKLVAHAGAVRNGSVAGTFGAAVAGVASGTAFTYDDVGYFMFNANGLLDATYTAVDGAVDCTADFSTTLSAGGQYGCKIGSAAAGYFGRFIPDHFDVTTNSNGTMAAACVAAGFTYTGQAMGYGTAPALTIKPMNAATGGSVAQNYSGSFQKLTAAGVTITAPTADGTQNGKDGLTKTALAATMSAGSLANSSGTLTYTLAAGDQYTYARNANALVGAYTSSIPLVVAAVGDGEVSSAGTLPTLSPTGVSLRFGRLKLSNVHGSELLNLPVPLELQYWNGTQGWVLNNVDSCTGIVQSNIKLSNASVTLASVAPVAGTNGKWTILLNKPSAKTSVDVCVDAATDAAHAWCVASTPLAKPYLQTGGAYNEDPVSRATFGVYKGSNEFIYMREAY